MRRCWAMYMWYLPLPRAPDHKLGILPCRENLSCFLCLSEQGHVPISLPICPWKTRWWQLCFYRKKWKTYLKDASGEWVHVGQILLSAGYTKRLFGMCQCLGWPFIIHFSRIYVGVKKHQAVIKQMVDMINISSFRYLCQVAPERTLSVFPESWWTHNLQ